MKRVLLVSQQRLFGMGLESLLHHQDGIQVVGQERDLDRAIERLQELRPDVVIVDGDLLERDIATLALGVFSRRVQARIIGLSLYNNTLSIYRKEQRMTRHVEDLFQVIESDSTLGDPASPEELSALATSRSRVYGFLGGVFNRLPDARLVQSLFGQDLAGFLANLGDAEGLGQDMHQGVKLIGEYIRSADKTPPDELCTELAVERTRLFRGIKPGYGPPPPYESVYEGVSNQPHMQSNVAVRRVYSEAGVAVPEDVHDQPDYIGFELDFMRHLAERESQAWTAGDQEAARQAIYKEHAFLQEHILRWIPHFCDIMIEQAKLDFYKGVAYLTKGFVTEDAENTRALKESSAISGPSAEPSGPVVRRASRFVRVGRPRESLRTGLPNARIANGPDTTRLGGDASAVGRA